MTRTSSASRGSNQNFPFEKIRNELQRIRVAIEGGVNGFLVYTNATRPAATTKPAGWCFYNSNDNFINCSDGANWRDPTGAIT